MNVIRYHVNNDKEHNSNASMIYTLKGPLMNCHQSDMETGSGSNEYATNQGYMYVHKFKGSLT